MATELNRSVGSVRSRCWTLGLNSKLRPWTDEELETLQAAYTAACGVDLQLNGLAASLGRDKANVSRKARSLGLTNQHRPKIQEKDKATPRKPKYPSRALYLEALSLRVKQWIAVRGHPRGARGLRHTAAVRLASAVRIGLMWADPAHYFNSEANRQRLSDNMTKNVLAGKMLAGHRVYSRCASGKRADLNNRYFRSAWEANYARYLNLLLLKGEILEWDYECQTFVFEKITRGTRAYTPDFKVTHTDGRHEWHEVKGWMDDKSRVRLERMARYYPAEKVLVIGADWFKTAAKTIAHVIPLWERPVKRTK